jgi:nucleoside-diphosphate-sugar epimerase
VLREAEEVALASGVATIVLRLGGIYGPGRMRLIEQVRGGAVAVPSTARFVNRIHRDDCAGAIAHLLGLAAPEALYLGVDDDPADLRQVLAWLAERLGVALPAPSDDGDAGHKRCKNGRLRASGYALRYPSFRDGYAALLDRLAAGEVAR